MSSGRRRVRMSWKLGALVAAGVALFGAYAAFAGGVSTEPGTIRITDREIKRADVDVGTKGLSAGDVQSLRRLLYNRRITNKAIGHSELVCTSTGNQSTMCNGSYFLPKGRIVVGGIVRSPLFYELAVLGGTGLYDNAQGTLTVTSLRRKPVEELLVFRLVG
jgi:hypothetical protein